MADLFERTLRNEDPAAFQRIQEQKIDQYLRNPEDALARALVASMDDDVIRSTVSQSPQLQTRIATTSSSPNEEGERLREVARGAGSESPGGSPGGLWVAGGVLLVGAVVLVVSVALGRGRS